MLVSLGLEGRELGGLGGFIIIRLGLELGSLMGVVWGLVWGILVVLGIGLLGLRGLGGRERGWLGPMLSLILRFSQVEFCYKNTRQQIMPNTDTYSSQ